MHPPYFSLLPRKGRERSAPLFSIPARSTSPLPRFPSLLPSRRATRPILALTPSPPAQIAAISPAPAGLLRSIHRTSTPLLPLPPCAARRRPLLPKVAAG